MINIHRFVWFVWAISLLAPPTRAEPALQGAHRFDPSPYIQYQEFKALKQAEKDLSKLRFQIFEIGGIDFVRLQSAQGTIELSADAALNSESLKEARCTHSEPLVEGDTVPTKREYEISKRVQAYSGAILATIERSCRVKQD